MAIIVNYFENFDKWGSTRAFKFLLDQKRRLGDAVRFEPGGREERSIAKSSDLSLTYARDFLGGRFELGERAIAEDPYDSLDYAKDVIKGRFELGERAIAKDSNMSWNYAAGVLNGRFELGEPAIAWSAYYSCVYAIKIIKGRFELGERAIAESAHLSLRYARDVIGGRFPAGEKIILAAYIDRSDVESLEEYLSLLKSSDDSYAAFEVKYHIAQTLQKQLRAAKDSLAIALLGDEELINIVRGAI